jgi:hypothetical protein
VALQNNENEHAAMHNSVFMWLTSQARGAHLAAAAWPCNTGNAAMRSNVLESSAEGCMLVFGIAAHTGHQTHNTHFVVTRHAAWCLLELCQLQQLHSTPAAAPDHIRPHLIMYTFGVS